MRAGMLVLAVAAVCVGEGTSACAAAAQEAPQQGGIVMQITSDAFPPGGRIPQKHTGEGEDVSPPLTWTGAPGSVQEFALICDDPDAPTPEPWVHWVLYHIPATVTHLAEGDNGGGTEGTTGWGSPGYRGPMPPRGHGEHRYFFKLYALDSPIELDAGASKTDLLEAMADHILAEAEVIGTYERQ